MARIPVYEGGVATRPVHQQGVNVRAGTDSFGGGAGLMALAQGMGRFGAALRGVKELEDMTRAKDAENDYARYMQEAMYGENGYMLSAGRNAFEGRQGFLDAAEKKRAEIAAKLSHGAKREFERASEARLLDVNKQVLVHSSTQQKEWVKEASNARVGLFAQDALNAVGNQEQVNRNIAAGLLELREQAKLEGIPREALAVKEKAYVSGVHNDVVLKLAQNDPLAAADYMERVGEQLSPEDRYKLETRLEGAILDAKGKRNGLDILIGAVSSRSARPDEGGGSRQGTASGEASLLDIVPDERGMIGYMNVAKKFLGAHEGRDGAALSEFIKRSSGVSIDPKATPWCAAFVNAVLEAAGMEGTGKLNARSFLQFGTPTSQPSVGDIVVLSRGDPNGWQGHVGFFQGFDEKGNVLVLGGNQGDKVSVAPYKADRVLGFRRAGRVDAQTRQLPNYSPQGLSEIEKRLQAIADPKEREATRSFIDAQMQAQKKAIDAAREETIDRLDQQLALEPQFDLSRLPIEMQGQIGLSGMNKLRDYQKKALETGGIATDEVTYDDLHTNYINDPAGFAELDLNEYRDKLSDEDWKEVRGWRKKAKEANNLRVRQEVTMLSKAMNMAGEQLDAAGLVTIGKKGSDLAGVMKRRAQFKMALGQRLKEFQIQEGREPDELEVEEMVNRLLLPVIIKRPGMIWDSEDKAYLFEGRMRPDGTSVEVEGGYETIPYEMRKAIQNVLVAEIGRQPTNDEIYRRYFEWQTGEDLGDETMEERERKVWEKEKMKRDKREEATQGEAIDPTSWYEMPIPAW